MAVHGSGNSGWYGAVYDVFPSIQRVYLLANQSRRFKRGKDLSSEPIVGERSVIAVKVLFRGHMLGVAVLLLKLLQLCVPSLELTFLRIDHETSET